MNDAQESDRIEVEIRGPGHHERAARALPVIAAVTAIGLDVVVTTDLRPRLADDIRALLDAGASRVRLEADGLSGDLVPGTAPMAGESVVVVLRPGELAEPEVKGAGSVAIAIRDALTAIASADDHDR